MDSLLEPSLLMTEFRIEASNRVVDENGTVLIDSFWRDDCLVYMALRDAGFTHGEVAHQMGKKARGGGPHPSFYHEDEAELMDKDVWDFVPRHLKSRRR